MASNTLPLHPSKRHPLTGEPIQALWVRPDGRIMWPILGASEGGEGEGGEGEGGGSDGGSGEGGGDVTWDDLRSSWEQGGLTPGQIKGRLEASRTWEKRAKSAPTVDELKTLRDKAEKHDALEHELSSDKDKAVTEAKKATQTELDAKYQPMLAETAFRVAIGDRNARVAEGQRKTEDQISEFIGDLNLTRFLNDDGSVDTARVLSRVEQFAPAMGSTSQPKGPKIPAGRSTNGSGSGLSSLSGGDLYDRLHPKKSQSA